MWQQIKRIVWKSHKKTELKPAIATMVVWKNHLVAGSYDGTIRTFSTEGKNKRTRVEHRYSVECLLVVDEELWSASSDFTISVWYFEGEKPYYVLKGHTDVIDSIVRRNDEVISASWDQTIRFWDIKSKTCTNIYKTSMNFVSELALHNNMIVAAGAQYIKVYTNQQFDSKLTISKPHEDGVHFLCIWNDLIVSASGAHTIIKVWDMNGELKKVLNGHFYCIKCITIIDDQLFSGSTGLILIWNNLQSNPIEIHVALDNGPVRSFCKFDDKLFVGTHSGNILVYEQGTSSQVVEEISKDSDDKEVSEDGKHEDLVNEDSSDHKSEKQEDSSKEEAKLPVHVAENKPIEKKEKKRKMEVIDKPNTEDKSALNETKAKLRKTRKQTENNNFIPW